MTNIPICFWIALGFTIFSICSVAFKLKGKINAFPILKCIAYVAILAVILLIGRKYIGNRYPGYVSLNENGVMVPDDLIILLKSIVPDKLPSNGYGFEEWR